MENYIIVRAGEVIYGTDTRSACHELLAAIGRGVRLGDYWSIDGSIYAVRRCHG